MNHWQSIKAVAWFVVIAAGFTALIVWSDDIPNETTWKFRIGSVVVALLAICFIAALHFRRDTEPDYLHSHCKTYFNRDGFCFAIGVSELNGIASIDAYYQNQFEKPCGGLIALRPARGFLLNRPGIETIVFRITCGPAAYGYARLPIAIPAALQGKRQLFEVGASVFYPDGRGRRLRFRDGIFLRTDVQFDRSLETAVTIASFVAWHPHLTKPAMVKLELPTGVAVELPSGVSAEAVTLRSLDDA